MFKHNMGVATDGAVGFQKNHIDPHLPQAGVAIRDDLADIRRGFQKSLPEKAGKLSQAFLSSAKAMGRTGIDILNAIPGLKEGSETLRVSVVRGGRALVEVHKDALQTVINAVPQPVADVSNDLYSEAARGAGCMEKLVKRARFGTSGATEVQPSVKKKDQFGM